MSWITEEWRSAWKWSSTWLDSAVIVAPILYTQVEQLQPYLPVKVFLIGMSVVGTLRLMNTLRKKTPEPPA
jgi:hypothetical protein